MKVSIIAPVYNVSAYIERCVKSVMSQTYQDIECILVNDASPDDSIAIAERLIADYNGPVQFRILNHEHNRGQSAARNTGADAATGDYLYYMDSDDEITPDCIEKLSRPILNDPTIEMVEGCYVLITTDNDNVISEHPVSRPQLEFATQTAVRDFYFSKEHDIRTAWNKLVKRTFFLKNQLYFKNLTGEDDFWYFHYNRYLNHLYIIPDITYKYYKHANSVSTNPSRNYRTIFERLYAEIAKDLSPEDSAREVKYFLNNFSLFYIEGPTTPTYKQVACQFLKILKDNHCIKEMLFLKSVILLSKVTLTRVITYKLGFFIKNFKTKRKIHKLGLDSTTIRILFN